MVFTKALATPESRSRTLVSAVLLRAGKTKTESKAHDDLLGQEVGLSLTRGDLE